MGMKGLAPDLISDRARTSRTLALRNSADAYREKDAPSRDSRQLDPGGGTGGF